MDVLFAVGPRNDHTFIWEVESKVKSFGGKDWFT